MDALGQNNSDTFLCPPGADRHFSSQEEILGGFLTALRILSG